jgi:hypothetical protein
MHSLSAPTSLWVKIDIVSCVYPCYKSRVVSKPGAVTFASETFIFII